MFSSYSYTDFSSVLHSKSGKSHNNVTASYQSMFFTQWVCVVGTSGIFPLGPRNTYVSKREFAPHPKSEAQLALT